MARTVLGRDRYVSYAQATSIPGKAWVWVGFHVLACWSVWFWVVMRMWDHGDERWGLLPLLTVLVALFWLPPSDEARGKCSLLWAALGTLVYAATYHFVPKLIQASLAALSLSFVISCLKFGRVLHVAICGLLLLSLPILASMQFYLGYPLGVISGAGAAFLLQMEGLPVCREGTCLRWGAKLVSIDGPCSGVKMLWAAVYLACAVALFSGLGSGRTMIALLGAIACVMGANAVRSAALFHLETNMMVLPEVVHEAAGMMIFAGAGVGIVALVSRLARKTSCASSGCSS